VIKWSEGDIEIIFNISRGSRNVINIHHKMIKLLFFGRGHL